jgi:hypothetical protein
VIALALALLVVMSLSSASAATPVAVPGIAAIRLGGENYAQTHLPQYETVFLGPGRLWDLSYIKRYTSRTRVLQWTNISFLSKACGNPAPPTCPTAVGFSEALAHDQANPSDPWILRDAAGNPIGYRAYPGEVYANPGSASYQLRAGQNLIRSLTASTPHWNGVNLDDVERNYYNSAGNPIHGTAPSPSYPTNESWYPAAKSLFTSVGSHLRQQGFYVAGNAAVAADATSVATQAWWTDLASAFDGFTQEYFEQHAFDGSLAYNGNTSAGDFNDRLRFVDIAQKLGKDFFGGMHYDGLCAKGPSCTLSDALMYGIAAFKLKWDGSGGGYRMAQTVGIDPWNAAWTRNIGTPVGAMYAVAKGWRRNYTRGTVIVNPKAPGSGAITFRLGATYVAPNGKRVTSVTLQPVRAMILSRARQR